MKGSALTLTLVGITLLASCSSISVNTDFDPSADFSKFKTYTWIEKPVNVSGNAQQAQVHSGLLGKRIMNAVDGQMVQKGFTKVEDNPDIFVVYHTGVQDKVQVTDWGYGYGPYGGWYGGGGVDVYQYQEGTLIVDLVDAATKQLVWRGTAQAVLGGNKSPEQQQQILDNVAGRMFQKYPPKT